MPLHDVGYRPWQGTPRRGGGGWVIAITGLTLAWKSRWLRRIILFAWSPAVVFAGVFFAFEQAVDQGLIGPGGRLSRSLEHLAPAGGPARTIQGGLADPVAARRVAWSLLLTAFMRAPQAVVLAVVVGLVAPRLVAGDLRAKAWLVYFTRPVSRTGYILGKAGTLTAIVALVTLLPALTLWVLGVVVSPSVSVALDTWDLPLRIVAAAAAVTIPTVLLALAYSSLTAESRIAAFAWFATWVACWIAHGALSAADLAARAGPEAGAALTASRGPAPDDELAWFTRAAGVAGRPDRWAWLSLFHAQGVTQSWIFGIERRWPAVLPSLLSLTAVALGSLVVLYRRVDAPARA